VVLGEEPFDLGQDEARNFRLDPAVRPDTRHEADIHLKGRAETMIRRARCGVNREEAEADAVGKVEAIQARTKAMVFAA
jgi:hypothetical protein